LGFLQLPELSQSTAAREQQLLTNWQQQKAYSSAYASWVKAWIMLMQLHGARGPEGVKGTMAKGSASASGVPLPWLMEILVSTLKMVWYFMGINQAMVVSVSRQKQLPLPSTEEQMSWLGTTRRCFEQEQHKSTVLGIQLVQLQWVSRAVAAAGHVLLQQWDGIGGSGSSASVVGTKSTHTDMSSGNSTRCIGSSSSSHSSSTSAGCGTACGHMGSKDSTSTTTGSSSRGRFDSTYVREVGAMDDAVFAEKVPTFSTPLDGLVMVALLQRKCLTDWHRYAGGGDMSFVEEGKEEARTRTAAAAGLRAREVAGDELTKPAVTGQGAAEAITQERTREAAGARPVPDAATAGGVAGMGPVTLVTKPAREVQAAGEEAAEEVAGQASAGGPVRPVQDTATAGKAAEARPRIKDQLAASKATQEVEDLLAASRGQDSCLLPYSVVAAAGTAAASADARPLGAACHGRACFVGDGACGDSLPRRFSGLPLQGLPPAVVDQLQHFDVAWPAEELSVWMHEECGLKYYQGLGKEQQQALVHDLLRLGAVFLVEVPVSVGCSNPGCVSLAGASEVAVSNKVCTGCKVVYYCSRKCQVEHWKVHKKMCQQLKQQQ
jgi:hypothetical protein